MMVLNFMIQHAPFKIYANLLYHKQNLDAILYERKEKEAIKIGILHKKHDENLCNITRKKDKWLQNGYKLVTKSLKK